MDRFRIISLVITLLVAQFSYAGHYHPVDEHHPVSECFQCIHASFLDNALPANFLITTNSLLSESLCVDDNKVVQFTQNKLFDARAPPHQK